MTKMNSNPSSVENHAKATKGKSLFGVQNFKGVESFLRKVAFNLGNKPSQTEVKIISCIPIDVSDLQEKIYSLEKQLEEMKRKPAMKKCQQQTSNPEFNPRLMCNTFIGSSNNINMNENCTSYDSHVSHKSEGDKSHMNKSLLSECIVPNPESKIEPVCPDLPENSPRNPIRQPVTSVAESVPQEIPSICECTCEASRKGCEDQPTKRQSKASFIFTTLQDEESCDNNNPSYKMIPEIVHCSHLDVAHEEPLTSQPKTTKSPEKPTTDPAHAANNKHKQVNKHIFRNRKLFLKRNPKNKTQLALSAQTSTPFNSQQWPVGGKYWKHEDAVCRAYFAEVIKKQYQPRMLFSDTSKLTPPVCRDVPSTPKPFTDIEICSCCYEPFKNIDKQKYMINELNTRNTYYDSSLYDLIPVKEQATKVKNTIQLNNQKKVELIHRTYKTHQKGIKKKLPNKVKREYCKGSMHAKKKRHGCVATNIINNDRQTVKLPQVNKPKTKTDATIDQIKSILQSVLEEVKISSQAKSSTESESKKDAFVQKGTSKNLIEEYSILNSLTYNPFNVNPCVPACSRDMATIYYNQMKYFHNWPFLYQHLVSRGYNMDMQQKPTPLKPSVEIATNTDLETKNQLQTESEPQKLIKDLYKPMIITPDESPKDTSGESYSRYYFQKGAPKNIISKVSNVVQTISRVFVRKNSAAECKHGNNTTKSKLNRTIVKSTVGTNTDRNLRKGTHAPHTRLNSVLECDTIWSGGKNFRSITEYSPSEDESSMTVISPAKISNTIKALQKFKSVFKSKQPIFTARMANDGDFDDDDDDDESSSEREIRTVYYKVDRPPVLRVPPAPRVPPPAISIVHRPRNDLLPSTKKKRRRRY